MRSRIQKAGEPGTGLHCRGAGPSLAVLRRAASVGPGLSSRPSIPTSDDLLIRFLDRIESRGIQLYPEQESAILELYQGHNVIQNTPTGSGKSLVAEALHYQSLHQGRRSVYTCPIKALVNEKWLALCREFGAENVGLSTGDATVNRQAPILCCTAEILANIALKQEPEEIFEDIVVDEFHYYSDPDRGTAWQIPLLTLSRSRFLLMSATLGDTGFFEEELTRLTGRRTATIRSAERPVPLEFEYSEIPLAQKVEDLVSKGRSPLYVVHFSQQEAGESAQDFTSINVCSRDEKSAIAEAVKGFRFSTTYGPVLKRWIRHGIGAHHAGLLPRYRILVEQLAQKGLLKIVCGTDTLGVGINIPIRTVVFSRLCKYDGRQTGIVTVRDFHQIAGRAGRKGFDDRGWVVAQAPEHVIENLKLERKAAKGGRKFVRRKPPERNYVPWDQKTFERLVRSRPEPLVSRFEITHGMLINVLGRRKSDGCEAMRRLVRACHDSPGKKREHARRGWQLFRALLDRNIVELPKRGEGEKRIRVNVELQENYSMNQTLSLFLHEAVEGLDPQEERYPLVVLTLVESILEDPALILARQLDLLKAEAVAEMKAEGIGYEERMEKLESMEHPKPEREFVYGAFNEFASRHPWVGEAGIRPKSIAREMFESFCGFGDYIKRYSLARAEGLLLRHLSGTYKTLVQTVPDKCRTAPVREIESYLEVLIAGTDSSLLEEWRRMQDPLAGDSPRKGEPAQPPPDITRDRAAFEAHIRQVALGFLRQLSAGFLEPALEEVPARSADELEGQWRLFQQERQGIRLDPEARNRRHSHFRKEGEPGIWILHQTLVDPGERNDWFASFRIDLAESRKRNRPAMAVEGLRPLV